MPHTRWFEAHHFTPAEFKKGKAWVFTHDGGSTFSYKLRERMGYTTWYKEAAGGSLIVLEVTEDEFGVKFGGYCPLLLFGIWERKLSFKPDAGWLTRYRKEGWELAQAFRQHLAKHDRTSTFDP